MPHNVTSRKCRRSRCRRSFAGLYLQEADRVYAEGGSAPPSIGVSPHDLLMGLGCMIAMAFIRLRQGRVVQSGWIAVFAGVVVLAGFGWAVSVGGDAIYDRFFNIAESGVVQTFQESRGFFLEYTLRETLFEYPLGAGLGRWGMMSVLRERTVELLRSSVAPRVEALRLLLRDKPVFPGPDVEVEAGAVGQVDQRLQHVAVFQLALDDLDVAAAE